MTLVSLNFFGITGLIAAFQQIIDSAIKSNNSEWFVASAVVYGEVLEWNTPHWRVAIHILASEIQFDGREQQNIINAMIAGGFISKEVILRLKAKVQDMILAHGLVDTGNYLGSIAIGPSMDEALSESDAILLDRTTSVFHI